MSIAFVVILAIVIVAVVVLYSYLAKLNARADDAYLKLEANLQKRYSLLPSLFEATQELMVRERALFREINSLRSLSTRTKDADAKLKLDSQIVSPLSGILRALDSYSQIKSDEKVQSFQVGLSEVERQIGISKEVYNQAATAYNNALQIIPTNIIAKILKYNKRSLYESFEITVNI